MSVHTRSDLNSRIKSWNNEVISTQQQQQRSSKRDTRLPKSSSRQPLKSTSANPQERKCHLNDEAEEAQQKHARRATSRKSKRDTTSKVEDVTPGPSIPTSAKFRASKRSISHTDKAQPHQSSVRQHLLSTSPSARKQHEPPPQAQLLQRIVRAQIIPLKRSSRNSQVTEGTTLQPILAIPKKRKPNAQTELRPKSLAQKQSVSTKRKGGNNMAPQNKDTQDAISGGRKLRSNAQILRRLQQEQDAQAGMVHRPKGSGELQALTLRDEREDDVEQEMEQYPSSATHRGTPVRPRGQPSQRALTAGYPQYGIRDSHIEPPLLRGPSLRPGSEQPPSIVSLSDADAYDRPFSSPSKRTGSPIKKAPGSPNKGDRTLGKPKADASIGPNDLVFCSPAIRVPLPIELVLTIDRLKGKLPKPVVTIRELLDDEDGYLPRLLKSHYQSVFDTPNKTKGKLTDNLFQNNFPSTLEQAIFLKDTVEYVIEYARWNEMKDAHERQWGSTVVAPLINAVVQAHSGTRFLNLESCSIQPVEIRPTRQNGDPIADADVQSKPPSTNSAATANDPTPTSRMVDYGLGLRLTYDEERTISMAFSKISEAARSLNQSLSYCDTVPLLMDLGLKRKTSNRNPVTQLAVWQGAGFKKRMMHGWDMESMPMLGVVVNGHEWKLYVTFQVGEDELIMMGPFTMGNTSSIRDTWEILYKLDAILRWGEKDYRAWFEKQVLKRAKDALTTTDWEA